MAENNKSYRIRTNVGKDKFLDVNINQDIDELEILSLKIGTDNFYRLHTSGYGCLVGRVLANGAVGIPNVKLSVFIAANTSDLQDPVLRYLYPYTNVKSKDDKGIRYNLLPDKVSENCHQDVGTFPNKRLVLDDANVVEVFDKYYKYTTTTNAAGDYMIFGLPVGNNLIHSELDLSDIGILSQKPYDLYYKGYNKTQFANSSQFKTDTNLDYLTQIISQDDSVYVYPFWGDDEVENMTTGAGVDNQVKITRNDINIDYKFEPTCIFIGSLIADDKTNGFSKNCIPTERSGKMDRLTTGAGTIEMIRKTSDGRVESFSIEGNNLIDGNGTWCYQIPMNLDYMKTDEFGNFVPAENELTGIPTRTRVRFRVSLADYESDSANAHLPKLLIPNNPTLKDLKVPIDDSGNTQGVDYNFGTYTRDDSFRDLFWNNVYTVKQYIPRIQNVWNEGRHIDRNKNFSGIKAVNVNGSNNPMPYNNIRVQLTFLFVFQCIIFKTLVFVVKVINKLIYVIKKICSGMHITYITLEGGMCPALEGWYMALGAKDSSEYADDKKVYITNATAAHLIYDTYNTLKGSPLENEYNLKSADAQVTSTDRNGDIQSSDNKYMEITEDKIVDSNGKYKIVQISGRDNYFVKCVELNFAMEYEVIQFDFYNDWINGTVFLPRWFAEIKRKKRMDVVVACNESFNKTRRLVQQCALGFTEKGTLNESNNACGESNDNKCHKQGGRKIIPIMGSKNHGIIQTYKNRVDDKYLYYLRPCEIVYQYKYNGNPKPTEFVEDDVEVKAHLFATDLVLLGSVLECNKYGLPLATGYPSSSFIMPPPTGMLLNDTQEMGIGGNEEISGYTVNYRDINFIGCKDCSASTVTKRLIKNHSLSFLMYNKRLPSWGDEGEAEEVEISGIDWGYNPFKTADILDTSNNPDNTKLIMNQVAGHFLEIGCTFSMTNQKSCINLTRICELGSEMAQSHYNRKINGDRTQYSFSATTGIISSREVIGEDLRTKFASLNCNSLSTVIDASTGYLMYDLIGYTPYNFDGSALGINPDNVGDSEFIPCLNEAQSVSYLQFRFNRKIPADSKLNFRNKFLLRSTGQGTTTYFMPMYENSFYFYFGLKDGNTAIDRLYTDYLSECPSKTLED